MAQGQPQPGAGGAGGEEGIEDLVDNGRLDAAAVVDDPHLGPAQLTQFIEPVAALDPDLPLLPQRVAGVDQQVDQHLQQLLAIRLDGLLGLEIGHQLHLLLAQGGAHQSQALLDDGIEVLPHRRCLVVAGARILQQAASDGTNALDLGQHQRQLLADRLGRLPQLQLHQLHIAEDHRQGVVDLVGHPGRQLAKGRQLLADQQLLARLGQHMDMIFQLGSLELEALGAFGHLLLQLVGAAGHLLLVRLLPVQHGVKLATELGQLVVRVEGQRADASRLPRLHLPHHLVHPLDGGEEIPRAAIDQQAGEQQQQHHAGAQLHQIGEVGADDGPLEKAHIEHAEPFAPGPQQRLVARDIPGVVDESAVNPHLPPPQHLLAHRRRDPGAHRPAHLTTAADRHIGAHPQIVEKQGDGADAAIR